MPATIKGAALIKVNAKLAKLGLAREIEAKPGAPIWRRDDAGRGYALKLTAAGLKAVSIGEGPQDAIEHGEAAQPQAKNGASPDEGGHPARVAPRDGSKLARLIDLLQCSHGASCRTRRGRRSPGCANGDMSWVRERVGAGGSIYRISGVAGCRARPVIEGDAAADRNGEPTPKAGQTA